LIERGLIKTYVNGDCESPAAFEMERLEEAVGGMLPMYGFKGKKGLGEGQQPPPPPPIRGKIVVRVAGDEEHKNVVPPVRRPL
jgi:hypothetical protein